jgi:hypothetical protein
LSGTTFFASYLRPILKIITYIYKMTKTTVQSSCGAILVGLLLLAFFIPFSVLAHGFSDGAGLSSGSALSGSDSSGAPKSPAVKQTASDGADAQRIDLINKLMSLIANMRSASDAGGAGNASKTSPGTSPGFISVPGVTDNVTLVVTPNTGAAPLKVEIRVSKPCGSLAAEGLYRVDYGDGKTSAAFGVCETKKFSHTYNATGTFNVMLQSRGNMPNATWQKVTSKTVKITGTDGNPAPSCTITASKTIVTAGEKYTIKWTSKNATEISGKGVRNKRYNGSYTVSQKRGGVYDHSVKVSGNGPDATCSVSVGVKDKPPVISSFIITNGGSNTVVNLPVTFKWSASGASHCMITGDYGNNSSKLPAKGTTTLSPRSAGTLKYELRCYSSDSSQAAVASKQVYARVYDSYR